MIRDTDAWHMTGFQQWVSALVVLAVVVLGVIVLWREYREAKSVKKFTDDFIPEVEDVVAGEAELPDMRDTYKQG